MKLKAITIVILLFVIFMTIWNYLYDKYDFVKNDIVCLLFYIFIFLSVFFLAKPFGFEVLKIKEPKYSIVTIPIGILIGICGCYFTIDNLDPVQIIYGFGRFIEEIWFRGLILTISLHIFKKYKRNKLYAVIFSSFLFSIVHIHRGLLFLDDVFIMAFILCCIAIMTDSIWIPVTIHTLLAQDGLFSPISATLMFWFLVYMLKNNMLKNKKG